MYAEELIFGSEKVETGASSDIKQATRIARAMVRELGMSDKVGPLYYGSGEQDLFSHQHIQQKMYSVNTEDLIDKEVRVFVEEGRKLAKKLLTTHKKKLHQIAKTLLEKETLTGYELAEIVFGKKKAAEMRKKKEKEAAKLEKAIKERSHSKTTSEKTKTDTKKKKDTKSLWKKDEADKDDKDNDKNS